MIAVRTDLGEVYHPGKNDSIGHVSALSASATPVTRYRSPNAINTARLSPCKGARGRVNMTGAIDRNELLNPAQSHIS
jgi:hypothetical protein